LGTTERRKKPRRRKAQNKLSQAGTDKEKQIQHEKKNHTTQIEKE